MVETWLRIERRLAQLGCLDAMGLRPGAGADEIARLESYLGVALPDSVKQSLAIHDGQDGFGLVYGTELLSIAGIRREWANWRALDEDDMNAGSADMMGSVPPGFIKPLYCNRAWIPLTHDGGGNHMGLDFDPDSFGQRAQVIAFGRDEEMKRLLANSFETFFAACAAWLERATWNGAHFEASDSL